jgi:predicted HTH domain antitoxin
MLNLKLSAILRNCRDFSDELRKLSEKELQEALEIEATTRRRKTVIRRLIVRLAAVQQEKVKQELTDKYLWKGVANE